MSEVETSSKVLMHVVVTCSAMVEMHPEDTDVGVRCSMPVISSGNTAVLFNGSSVEQEQLAWMGTGTVLRAAISSVEGQLAQYGLQAEVATPTPGGMKS